MFQKINSFVYRTLGPATSTRLAQSNFGKFLVSKFYGKQNRKKIFNGKFGIKLKLSVKEASLLGFSYLGIVNPIETQLIKHLLTPGDSFIDVGAYIDGWYTLLASKLVGEKGNVYSFEPVENFYNLLHKNILLNKTKNIILEKIAVSNTNGYKTFYVGNKASSFYEFHTHGEELIKPKKTRVRSVRLDDYIKTNKIANLKIIKIDVECAEMEVLEGLIKSLKKINSPDLIIEVIDLHLKSVGKSEKELIKFLRKFGYSVFTLHSGGTHKYINEFKNRGTVNLYFSKNQKEIQY